MISEKIENAWIEFEPGIFRAGVDEVGRGCLAGPVVAGAVIFKSNDRIEDYMDSKLLSESRREELNARIQAEHYWSLGIASLEEIERLNILWASQLAMVRALEGLQEKIGKNLDHVYVDGHIKIKNWNGCSQTPIIGGDQKVKLIAAGSILAKVYRDGLMKEIAKEHPQYDFTKNKGYGAPKHREAIKKYGVTIHHRKAFKGVSEYL